MSRDRLRQQSPELWVVPAQVMSGAVAVIPNAGAQAEHFGYELVSCHAGEVVVHACSMRSGCARFREAGGALARVTPSGVENHDLDTILEIYFRVHVDLRRACPSTQGARQFSGDGASGSPQEEYTDALHVHRQIRP